MEREPVGGRALQVAPVGSHIIWCDSLIQASSQTECTIGNNTRWITRVIYCVTLCTLHWTQMSLRPCRLQKAPVQFLNKIHHNVAHTPQYFQSDLESSLVGQTMSILVKWGSQPACVWERGGWKSAQMIFCVGVEIICVWGLRWQSARTQLHACMLHANY